MPVVPRIDRPPTMPSRALSVFAASASPPGMAISTSASAAHAGRRRDFGDGVADHAPRHRIDRRLAGRQRQAGPRDRADALAGAKRHAGAGRAGAHRGQDQRAMGHIGIVARVLDDARRSPSLRPFASAQARSRALAARQRELDRIGKVAGHAAPRRPLWPPRWRRRRWSSRAAAGVPRCSMLRLSFSPGRCADRHDAAARTVDDATGARLIDCRAALGRRQDHGDARAPRRAPAPRRRGARGQSRARLHRSGLPCRGRPARASVNLDFLGDAASAARRARRATRRDGADVLVIEGVMGLFDGAAGAPGRGAALTADLAARFGLPVLLVLDVARQAQSAAAVRPRICHPRSRRAHRRRRFSIASPASGIARSSATPSRRWAFPCSARCRATRRWRCPSGISASCRRASIADLDACLERLAAMAERHLDLDAIMACAAPLAPAGNDGDARRRCRRRASASRSPRDRRLQLHLSASDRRAGGAPAREIVAFSPLADEPPPERCDSCWLPGGYPELHAATTCRRATLSRRDCGASPQRARCTASAAATWCSARASRTRTGRRHAMAGLLGHATSFAARKLHLGYRSARLLADGPLGRAARVVRGHEFHYASLLSPATTRRSRT